MWHLATPGTYNFFLEILLLFSFARATFSLNDTKYSELSGYSGCEFTNDLGKYNITCPTIMVQISILNGGDSTLVNCTQMRGIDDNLPPEMNIGNSYQVEIADCYLCVEPIAHLLNQIGIGTAKYLAITGNGLEVNFTRMLTGLSGLEKLTISPINTHDIPWDLFYNSKEDTLIIYKPLDQPSQYIFDRWEKLTKLDIFAYGLEFSGGIFRNQHKLKELNLSNVLRQRINKKIFEGATSLQVLDLGDNWITRFEPDVFSLLPNLREIYLNENDLSELPSQLFANNRNLSIIHISANSKAIKLLPPALFANLLYLQEFHVQCYHVYWKKNYDFSRMELSHTGIRNRKSLIYENCAAREISDDFFNNSNKWIHISLSYNELLSLPVTLFAHQHNLYSLDLSNNKLESLQNGLFHYTSSLRLLNLSYNQLTDLPGSIFTSLVNLEELDLNNNRLSSLLDELFRETTNLVQLKLSHNQLIQITAEIFSPLVKLKVLYLDYNHLKTIESGAQSRLSTLTQLTFAGNTWDCDCETIPLVLFTERNSIIVDFKKIYCTTPKNDTVKHFLFDNGLCQENHHMLITLIVSASSVSLLISVTLAVYYKHKTEIKALIYSRPWLRGLVSEYDVDKNRKYDAFVSYAHKDREFIGRILVPKLEQSGPIRFKLCIHVRDFIVGESISNQIVRAIDDARRTIFVLSKHFIDSVWTCMEFRLALQAALNEGRTRVIVIMYGDIGDIESLDPLMSAYLKTNTYLEWGDPWFWERLRYAMPHSGTAPPVEICQATTAV